MRGLRLDVNGGEKHRHAEPDTDHREERRRRVVAVGGDMLEPLQLLDRMPGEVGELVPKLLRQQVGAVRDMTRSAH